VFVIAYPPVGVRQAIHSEPSTFGILDVAQQKPCPDDTAKFAEGLYSRFFGTVGSQKAQNGSVANRQEAALVG